MRPLAARFSSSSFAVLMSVAITSAPSAAKASTEARPMPWAAAVTNAFLPLSLWPMTASLLDIRHVGKLTCRGADCKCAAGNLATQSKVAPTLSPPLLQRRLIGADPLGIDAEITPSLPAFRAHIDAAAGTIGRHANDDVVGEAHEGRALIGVDAPLRRIAADNGPAGHALRRGERPRKGLVGWQRCFHRAEIGIALLLQRRGLLVVVADVALLSSARLHHRRGKRGRVVGVGSDVVDARHG